MASESSSTRGERNQDRSLCAAFASLRRTTDRHRSARVFGQDSILDHGRLGDEAARFPTLFLMLIARPVPELARIELAFLNLLRQLDSTNRNRRVVESFESEHRLNPLFHPADGPVR